MFPSPVGLIQQKTAVESYFTLFFPALFSPWEMHLRLLPNRIFFNFGTSPMAAVGPNREKADFGPTQKGEN